VSERLCVCPRLQLRVCRRVCGRVEARQGEEEEQQLQQFVRRRVDTVDCIYVYVCVCVCVCMCVCVHSVMYVCMYVCICVHSDELKSLTESCRQIETEGG